MPLPLRVFAGCFAVVVCSVCLLTERRAAAEDRGDSTAPVRIGLVNSLFKDVPDTIVDMMAKPFGALMAAQTGMTGQMIKAGDADSLGQELNDAKMHLGIFHGVEFAWARQKYPHLKPLVIAVNEQKHLRAFLIVRTDNEANDFGDLQGKTVCVPKGSRDHCLLFMERRCEEAGACSADLLGKVTTAANAEDALDDLVDGNMEAAIVDGLSLEGFKLRKPGRASKLKVIVESEVFPAAVVAYCPGVLNDAVIKRFRDSLLTTHKSMLGKQLLTLWRLTGFEAIPADYEQTLNDIVKAYPAPK